MWGWLSSGGSGSRPMARVFVSVGSNVDRLRNVRSAVAALRRQFGELLLSRVYDTEAVGFDGPSFLNLVAGFDTAESVFDVAARLRHIEKEHGRKRNGSRFAPRTLDLDLLLYGDLVLEEGGVCVPRDEITRFAFVLCPMAEIAPQLNHPVIGRSFAELWQGFAQPGQRLSPVEIRL